MQSLITSFAVLAEVTIPALFISTHVRSQYTYGKSGIPRILTYPAHAMKSHRYIDILSPVQADGTMTKWIYLTTR